MYSILFGVVFLGVLGVRGFLSPLWLFCACSAADSNASGPTVADSSVGSACTCCCAGVKFSSMGASAAVCAKFSGVSAAAASVFVASSLANRRWKDDIDHCCCLRRKAEGVMVLIDRGFARYALEGDAVMARTAVRRRRNLQ
jgi:hypothetical protein